VQVALLPDVSVAVQVTVLVPSGKTEPEGGLQTTVTPGQLSVTAGAGKVTTTLVSDGLLVTAVIADGQVIFGASLSRTVTVNWHCDLLPEASLAVQVTVVTPLLNLDPEAGEQTTVGLGVQLSEAIGAGNVTAAEHRPGSVFSVTLAGQVITGGVMSTTVTTALQLALLPAGSVTVNVTEFGPRFEQLNVSGVTVREAIPHSAVLPPST
jgi:hypothetical protein